MSKRRKLLIVSVAFVCLALTIFLFWRNSRTSQSALTEIGDYRISKARKHFTIDLASNGTTGYSWSASDYNSKNVLLEDIIYHSYPSEAGIVGRGGYSRLKGQMLHSGKVEFLLTYAQTWEDGQTALVYRVTIISIKNKIKTIELTKVSD